MKLVKSKVDEKKEAKDLAEDPTLIFLANMNDFKFNVGDILIKKQLRWADNEDDDVEDKKEWKTEVDDIGAPVKYVYAFENKLGVGYVKKLKNDGKGPYKSNPTCVLKVIAQEDRLMLDPDYAEHLLLSHEEQFNYNGKYESYRTFRDEAMLKNKAICVETEMATDDNDTDTYDDDGGPQSTKEFKEFWKTIHVGEVLYASDCDLEYLGYVEWEVLSVSKSHRTIKMKLIKDQDGWRDIGEEVSMTRKAFASEHSHVGRQKPYPLTEENI